MKNIYQYISILALFGFLVFNPAGQMLAQDKPDFRSEKYREAIQNIVRDNDRFHNSLDVFAALDKNQNKHLNPLSGFRADTITTYPEIAFIEHDEVSVTFQYIPTGQLLNDTITVDIPAGVDWLTNPNVDKSDSTITIDVQINEDYIPNSATITVTGEFGAGNFVSCQATVLQGAAPQPFILVSPKYLAVSPEGGITDPFSVTHFNIDGWEPVFSENWIAVDVQTPDAISFAVDPNDSGEERDATIFIQDTDNPEIRDSLTIFQFVNTSAYIIATPSSGFITAAENTFIVEVNANTPWEVLYSNVPAGMINDSIISPGADSVSFVITENTGTTSRTASISLAGTENPAVSAQIEIVQAGSSEPFIIVTPQTSNVGPEAGSITLNVDANVTWEYIPIENPGNMLSEVPGGQNAITFNINENTTTTSRTAIGQIKAIGDVSPSFTFYIIQDAAYVLLNPRAKLVPCEGESFITHITRYNVDSIIADTSGFRWDVTIYENDSLQIDVSENTNPFPVSDTLVACSFSNPAICDTLIILQYACNQPYLVVTPKFQSVPYQGGTTDTFNINISNIQAWEIYFEDPVTWITDILPGENLVRFVVDENTSTQFREVSFQVRSVSNPMIFDSAVIFQDGAPAPVLIASPREQLVPHAGTDSLDFRVTWQNIENWAVDENSIPGWIEIDSAGGNLLSLDVLENTTLENRENQLVVFATNDVLIRDTVSIYQYSAFEKYILTAPRERVVEAIGTDSAGFKVITANVATWLVDSAAFPDWISLKHKNDSSFSITLESNQTISSRSASIKVYDSTDNNLFDMVQIFQYLGEEPVILVSPREQISYQSGGTTDPFFVETTGLDQWSVTSSPEWIQILQQGDIILLCSVDPNPDLETRVGTVYVGDPNIPDVFDSVKIYQFSTFDSYLLAQPRQKSFGQSGAQSTVFEITRANVLNWEAIDENLPGWIEVNEDGGDILDLKILENTTYETRHDSVFIFSDDNNGAGDTVLIYQYAANDTLLMASPRQQISSWSGEILDFEITVQNAGAWQVAPETVPAWVQVVSQGGNLLSLETLLNSSDTTRYTTISIFDNLKPDVFDSVSIYQFAAPESYILAAPRSDTVQFFGDDFVTFEITQVNLSGDLTIDDSTVPEWISASLNGNQLQLDIAANPLAETRDTVIYLFDSGDTGIKDSVAIYQYAEPEKYILVSPREQQIGHPGGSLFFNITAVNVDNLVLDETTVPEWISDFEISPASLSLEISQNDLLETRIANIKLYDHDDPTTEDSIMVFQYSGLDYYILAEPRERKTGNLADTLSFGITAVNLSAPWDAEIISGSVYANILTLGDTLLKVAVSENTDSITHMIRVKVFSALHPSAIDTVSIYQYSPFEPFIIINPTFQRFSSGKDSIYIHAFSNLESYSVSISPDEPQPPDTTWYNISKNSASLNDSVKLRVDFNPESYKGRTSYLTFRSPDSSFVNYFHFQQRKNSFNFITISGTVAVDDGGAPLDSVSVAIGQDTLFTNDAGFYTKENIGYGWVGVVSPQKTGYFFDPANRVFNNALVKDTVLNFTAIEINPTIEFNIEGDSLPICLGEQIDLSSPNYPTITVTGTFGTRSYKWFSIPDDPNLITDSASAPAYQVFKPTVTTTYYLVLYNYGTTDTAQFTLEVNPMPVNRDFNGPLDVCRNQAGVIYSVMDFEPGEYFQWELSRNGDVIRNYSSNIASMNWSTEPGDYDLTLYTINSFGCSSALTKTITVSNEEAPPESTVTKKSGDNMLVCSTTNPENFNFEWGWYEMIDGSLGEKYIIPDRNNWYCRLPENHTFDPIQYTYFVQLTYKSSSSCQTISFLNGNAPVDIPEISETPYSIFPNPTSGMIWLKFDKSILREVFVKIRDVKGQLIASETLNPGQKSDMIKIESVKNLRQGIYLVEVQVGESKFNSKIVVQ